MNNSIPPDKKQPPHQENKYLIMAIIQSQDERRVIKSLKKLGVNPVELATTGGFLGIQNITIMIGVPDDLYEATIEVLQKYCHQRVEYISTPLEGTPLPIPLSTPVMVGGATIFKFYVDQYEEF